MTSKELKKYIYENGKIQDVLEGIGMHSIVVREKYCTCGFNDGDNPRACTIQNNEYLSIKSYTREIINCSGLYTDIIDLVQFVLQCKNGYDAINKILGIIGLSGNKINNKSNSLKDGTELFNRIKNRVINDSLHNNMYDLSILNKYDKTPHIDLIKKDWITPKFADMYNIVFDYDSNRIIFPHFKWDDRDVILALIGRTVNPAYKELKIPKYLTLVGVGYRKENNIYGLSVNMERVKKEKKIIIFEAEKSVIKAHQCNYGIGVSVGCHDISTQQIKILLSLGIEEIIIAFDKDVSLEHIKKYHDILSSYIKVTIIYDLYDVLSDKDSPIDKGYKVFSVLYNNRKTYDEWLKAINEKTFYRK